jgi:hypothetical protein
VRQPVVTRKRIWLARFIAMGADAVQFGVFPIFAEGFASPLNIITDVIVGATMTLLVGFHIAFIPTFVVEMFPLIDLAPTWTIAVLIATRGGAKPPVIDAPENPRPPNEP